LIVTTSFVADTEVVDGAGGSVVVVDEEVVVATVATEDFGVDAVLGAVDLDDGPELEHAAPKAIDAVRSAIAADLRLRTTHNASTGGPVSGRLRG
jgi:hypothetical protein